jgi:hypothetical protein
VTLQEARKILPKFACGLGMCAKSVGELRASVREEIAAYRKNENPLTAVQYRALVKFLELTQVKP